MKKNSGMLLGLLAVGGIAYLALSNKTPAPAAAPSWWPAGAGPFPATAPANWPAGMAWPPAPGAPMPAGFIPMPMNTMPATLPQGCVLDANLPPDLKALVNTILSAPQQTDPSSYDAVVQLLTANNFPMAAACVQARKTAGAPIPTA